jgi:malate dehydrogenase (oxaloacetate-decarboxylating)(NADP+)
MTVILTPYWSGGTQRLKVQYQCASAFYYLIGHLTDCPLVLAPQPPPRGLFPAAYDSTLHAARCLAQLRSKDKAIEKYIYLSQLKHTNEELFYRLCLAHMPVCYNRSSQSRTLNQE